MHGTVSTKLWAGVSFALCLNLACSGKKRDFADEVAPLSEVMTAAPGVDASSPAAAGDGTPGDSEVCGPGKCLLEPGAPCPAAEACASGACEPDVRGAPVCCAEACSANGTACAADGLGCVECESETARCDGDMLRRCAAGALSTESCSNGCNAEFGACNELREGGTICEVPAQCASGICTQDVTGSLRCCEACEASGRACGTDGACVCAPGQQEVAGTCLSSVAQPCASGADCASGACVPDASGATICCAAECPAGSFCSADGSACIQCEGASATCDGSTSRRCENDALIETDCGNGCDPLTGVCTGLLVSGDACTASAQCASGECAPDLGGALRCCTPGCELTGRVCGADGSCVCPDPADVFLRGQCRGPEGTSCAAGADCVSDACEPTQAGAQVCCTGACNGQLCRASGQGCVQCEGGAPTCQGNASRSCVANAFVLSACANGCNPATGSCNDLLPVGSAGCTQSNQCAGAGSSCQGGRCCEFDCAAAGRVCDGSGACECPGGTTGIGGACLLSLGQPCVNAAQCASGTCQRWFLDADGDQHGSSDVSLSIQVCSQPGVSPEPGYVASSDDCCDVDGSEEERAVAARIFEGQASFFSTPQAVCRSVSAFDYDCDGLEVKQPRPVADCSEPVCRTGLSAISVDRPCGASASFTACGRVTLPNGTVQSCTGLATGMDNPIACH